MTRIEVFDSEAKLIKKLATHLEDESCYNDAFVVEAMCDYIEREARLLNKTVEELLENFLA